MYTLRYQKFTDSQFTDREQRVSWAELSWDEVLKSAADAELSSAYALLTVENKTKTGPWGREIEDVIRV